MQTSRNDRKYDVVLFGATGFTGRLVADVLSKHEDLRGKRWAIAGRSRDKLDEVKRALGGATGEVDVVVADAKDDAALATLALETRVIATTVGPYAAHGEGIVRACASVGTDYCDITGEVTFVRKMIDTYDAVARQSGARIVHCCGFDSIPSDIGVFLLHREAQRLGTSLADVRMVVTEAKGGFSGGTAASLIGIVEEATQSRDVRRLLADPYSLSPDRAHDLALDGNDALTPSWDPDLKSFVGPFVMAAVNTRIVRRSNALLGHAYGKNLRYAETMRFAKGPRGAVASVVASGAILGFFAAASVAPLRKLIEKRLPAAGTGPSEGAQQRGRVSIAYFATTEDGRSLRATFEGQGDPGYSLTSRMFAEAAVTLAAHAGDRSGSLTPAVALGKGFASRLGRVGAVFSNAEA